MIKNDVMGRLLGIIFGLILILFYDDKYVQLIGLSEIITCIFLHFYYKNIRFVWTAVCWFRSCYNGVDVG